MHWTQALARTRSARAVIDDLPCAGCGYNLRGLSTNDRCPECGVDITDSALLLAEPDIVAGSLRSIGRWCLAPFILLFSCLIPFHAQAFVAIILLTLALATLMRVVATGELRFRGRLESHPTCGDLVRWMWCVMLVEAGIALAAMVVIFASSSTVTIAFLRPTVILAWAIAFAGSLGITAWFGRRLSSLLGYDSVRLEFTIVMWLVAISVVYDPILLVLMRAIGAGQSASLIAIGNIGAGLVGLALILLLVAMLHLGNAIDRERGEDHFALEEEELDLDDA